MFKYYDALLNRSGDALAGHFVRLFDAAGNQIDIYADESETPIVSESGVANAAKSDSDGMVRFFVPSGDYDIRLYDASDTFLAAERAVPMVRGVTSAELLEDTTAASIGEVNEGNVQAALDAANTAIGERPTTAALASSSGGDMVGFIQPDTSAEIRTMLAKAREAPRSGQDFGAAGDGATDDLASLTALAVALRTADSDSTGRTIAETAFLPSGSYKITDLLSLAPANGTCGLKFTGAGPGSTYVVFDGAGATIAALSSRAVAFEGITFVSSGVDDEQVAFTINQTGNPLRSWRFKDCEFSAFFKCFNVTGASMCSEFLFENCQFSQCYILMENSNNQAVNWNFYNCHWENNELTTAKDKNLATIFKINKGTFVYWAGGSIIPHGKLVYFTPSGTGVIERTSHKITFTGVRIELVDDGAGSHTPIIDRLASGYPNGSNSPAVTISHATMLFRGSIPTTVTIANLWNNCKFIFEDIESEGGNVVGILDAVSTTQAGELVLNRARGITYSEDTTSRANTHDQHHVVIIPENNSSGTSLYRESKQGSLTIPVSTQPKYLYVRGPTGSLPQGGTTVNLPALPDHTMLLRLFCQRFEAAGQSLQVDLRDQADTTTYQTVTLASADRFKEDTANGKEMGFQIPSGTALMLKFTGTAEVKKGLVGIEYL